MIIDELNKKISDIENLANDKTGSLESKVNDLTDGILMVADAVDTIPEMVDEKIAVVTKEITAVKDDVKKVKTIKGDKGDKGDKGEPGMDGIDGINGSPDSGKDIAGKLNKLENVLDPKVIKGSGEYVNKTDLSKTISTLENQTRFLIQSNASKSSGTSGLTAVEHDSTLTGAGTTESPLSVVATSASDVAITVRAATTAALAGTWTYNNGTSGVGATLTRTTNGALPNQDGVSLSDGDRILIKNQASTLVNGVYVLTQKGVTSVSPTIFTRATDADTTAQLDELVVTVSEGSTLRGTVWGQQTNNPVVGTSAITFATVVSTAVTQATSGTQAINQIPLYTGTARQLTRGTANFKYNPTNDLFTIRGIDYTFPANNGDASQVLTTDGSGTLSWETGGGSPAGSDTQIQYNNAGSFGASSDLTFDPATSTLKAVTDNPLFRSTINFASGGGTDDLTASLATAFTGTPPTTFAVFAYGNIQIVNYINLVGGNFSQEDTITGSVSGAEGYVAYDDGVGQFYVSITNSIQFAATDVIDNANGVTADYDTSTTSDDIFFWFSTNGGSGGPIVITGTAQTLNDGIDITFGSTTGHGAEDSWQWSYKTLKNTWLTNNQAESAVSGYVNGSVYDNGSNNIVAINGLVQNGDDDRIFPLSFYQDLSSGNRNERERAYYGLDIFKGDPAGPLEFVVKTQKGIGAGPGTTEISTLTVGTLSGFAFISDKSFQVSTPLFVTQGSLFSWTGDINGNGITIDDINSTAILGNLSGGNNTKITIDDVNEHITISNLPAYDDDTAAGVGGLTAGMVYMTTGSGSAPLNAAGILMIKQ